MRRIKIIGLLSVLFLITMCFSFVALAQETTHSPEGISETPFKNFKVGLSYKTIGDGKLYATEFPFTVDRNGNIYLICVTNNRTRQLMVFKPSGEYLYSIWLPLQNYQLSTNEEKNQINVACSAYKTVLVFDANGTLIDRFRDFDSDSKYYDAPSSVKVSQFGWFSKEQTSRSIKIFLRSGSERTVYFEKKRYDAVPAAINSIVTVLTIVILAAALLWAYKTRKK